MMRCRSLVCRLLAFIGVFVFTLHAEPLFHWRFDEGSGAVARDVSGNGLDGQVTAEWATGEPGAILFFDGTAATQVTIDLPEEKRFGRGSWTFSAWIKPTRLGMPDSPEGQDTRRMFSYGNWPEAMITLNVGGNGSFGCYTAYLDVNGRRVSGSASSASGVLRVGEWAHVVMVCDMENRQLCPYINGVRQGARDLSPDFAPDFSVFGNLSVGCGWQNYWGHMAQVLVYRDALSTVDVMQLFREQSEQFGIERNAELVAREREALEAAARQEAKEKAMNAFSEHYDAATDAWLAGTVEAARAELEKIVADERLPAHYRSYAQLRMAQILVQADHTEAATAVYRALAANADYPAVHRQEAEERLVELRRMADGLPARDPRSARVAVPEVTEFAAEVHVAPDGDDDADGSRQHPFKTLIRARDAVRALKADGLQGAVCVWVHPGEYPVTETLTLTAEDSGTEGAPVVYRATELGQAVLYGGARISGFERVTDPAVLQRLPAEGRGKVWQTDLKAQGITDYGELRVRGGIGQPPAPPTLEVFVDEEPMTLSRWPNDGFVKIRELIEPGSAEEGKPSVIGYSDDRHARWVEANDPWLFGYWHFLWADATIAVDTIDTEEKTITTVKPYNYSGRGMNNHQGIIYYAFNLLEEIDQPGEWYLDREAGILYLYPPKDLADATVEIGMHSGPVITFDDVSHVRLQGLVLDLARYQGITASNSSDCLIAGCTIKRMAATGIIINGGERFGVFGCDLHKLGRRGIQMSGGTRETLEPANHYVENCRIYNFGRVDRTYTQGVTIGGVGNRLSHTLIYDCPTSVISLGGNDHLIQYNDVHSAVKESDDQGGIDMWGNPTFRGNIFRYNRFRSIGKTGSEHAAHGQAAIRFDDTISGQLVYGNILYQGSNGNFGAVQMNSGRDNIFDNNMFLDNRYGISGGWRPGNPHWKQTQDGTKQGAYTNDLYLERYPEIGRMFDDNGLNFFWRNIFWRCGTIARSPKLLEMFQNAIFAADEDPGFVDLEAGDLRLRPDAPVLKQIAFRPIPVEEIGLYEHPLRASWPVHTTPVERADWREGFNEEQGQKGVMPHKFAIQPIRVPRVQEAPAVDGRIQDGEWSVDPHTLAETPSRTKPGGDLAQAWMMHDGNALHVAVRVPMKGDTSRLSEADGEWGELDGVEICLRERRDSVGGRRPPVLILQGYPSGKLLPATDPEEMAIREAAVLARLSNFAASVDAEGWTGEWTIPIAAMGMSYKPGVQLQFNIGLKRTSPNDWTALAGALGANYKLNNAAVIVLE